MRKTTVTRVLVGGLAAGAMALAGADIASAQTTGAPQTTEQQHRDHAEKHDGENGHGAAVAELAQKLGKDPAAVKDAMKAAGQQVRKDHPSAKGADGKRVKPSTEERQARKDEFTTVLAQKLGVDKQTLATDLAQIRAEHKGSKHGGN